MRVHFHSDIPPPSLFILPISNFIQVFNCIYTLMNNYQNSVPDLNHISELSIRHLLLMSHDMETQHIQN